MATDDFFDAVRLLRQQAKVIDEQSAELVNLFHRLDLQLAELEELRRQLSELSNLDGKE